MPKGIQNHGEPNKQNDTESLHLRTGDEDIVSRGNGSVKEESLVPAFTTGLSSSMTKDEALETYSEARLNIIIQVAAIFSLDIDATTEFLSSHIFDDGEILREDVERLVKENKDKILRAQDALSIHLNIKFPFIAPIKQAELLNEGIRLVNNSLILVSDEVDKKSESPLESSLDRANQIARTLSSVAKTYGDLLAQLKNWRLDIQEIIVTSTQKSVIGSEKGAQDKFLTAKSIVIAARRCGVDPIMADRIASLVIYGEQVTHQEMMEE